MLFDLVTQTGSAVRKILKLRFANFDDLKPGDKIVFDREGSTIAKEIAVNSRILDSFGKYAASQPHDGDDYIFSSSYKSSHIALARVNKIVNRWYKKAGLKDVRGILSLRKTWEVHFRNPPSVSPEIDSAFQAIAQPQTLQETVLSQIEQAILSGRLTPGKNIVADEIAKKMGISRMPVRQALTLLEGRGFLKRVRGGVQVVQLSKKNLEEIIEVRVLLETTIAKIALPVIKDATIHKLKKIYKQYARATMKNNAGQPTLNRKFHGTVYRDADRPYLMQLIEDGWDRVSPYYHLLVGQLKESERALDIKFHQEMIKCAENRDPETFCFWLNRDIGEAARLLFGLL